MLLFVCINEDGKLMLVNYLGIDLGEMLEQIFSKLDDDCIKDDDVCYDGCYVYDYDYVYCVCDIEVDMFVCYNVDFDWLFEFFGCVGKLVVFVVCFDIFEVEKNQQVFYIGINQLEVLIEICCYILANFENLLVVGEYMYWDIYDIVEKYGKDIFLMIDKLGIDKMLFFFNFKGCIDVMLEKVKFFCLYFIDCVM